MASIHVESGSIGEPAGHRFPPLVRELSSLDLGGARMLSAYLDVRWDDLQQRRRTWLALRDQLGRLRDREPRAAEDVDRAAAWIAERAAERENGGTRGLALFLCRERGFERAVATGTSLPSVAMVGPSASLRPLLPVLAQFQPALCVVADNRVSRLWELGADGEDEDVAALESDVPKRHRAGGWSQLKLQHWRALEVQRHHGETALAIERWLTYQVVPQRVLLAGRPDVMAGMLRQLGPAARRCIRVVGDFAPGMHETELLAAFRKTLDEAVRDEGERIAARLDQWPGLHAEGVQAVVEAASQRRLETLVMAEELCGDAATCRRCGALASGPALGCELCGGDQDPIELGDALVNAAVRQDAQIHQLARSPNLERLEGVMARLRY